MPFQVRRKSSTLDDLEGHWQPVQLGLLFGIIDYVDYLVNIMPKTYLRIIYATKLQAIMFIPVWRSDSEMSRRRICLLTLFGIRELNSVTP